MCENNLDPPLNVLEIVAKAGDVRRVRVSRFRFGGHFGGLSTIRVAQKYVGCTYLVGVH